LTILPSGTTSSEPSTITHKCGPFVRIPRQRKNFLGTTQASTSTGKARPTTKICLPPSKSLSGSGLERPCKPASRSKALPLHNWFPTVAPPKKDDNAESLGLQSFFPSYTAKPPVAPKTRKGRAHCSKAVGTTLDVAGCVTDPSCPPAETDDLKNTRTLLNDWQAHTEGSVCQWQMGSWATV
jgi:hypothetical protein